MCVLVAKAKNARKITEQEIINCANSNPDGFGMAWVENGKVKTMRTFNVNEIIRKNDQLRDDQAIIYHFRIATHGSISKNNCHPFLSKEQNIAFAHNGILNIANHNDWTDSETAFRFIFLPILKHNSISSSEFNNVIETIIGSSKFAFLQGDETLTTFGNFIKEDGGILFSNSSYKSREWFGCNSFPTTCVLGNNAFVSDDDDTHEMELYYARQDIEEDLSNDYFNFDLSTNKAREKYIDMEFSSLQFTYPSITRKEVKKEIERLLPYYV